MTLIRFIGKNAAMHPLANDRQCGRARFPTIPMVGVFIAVLCSAGCGHRGVSEADLEQSMRETHLAASLREEGKIPAALERLEHALALDPENADALFLLGWMRYEAAHRAVSPDERRRLLNDSAERFRTGITSLIEYERTGAVLAEGRNMLGVVLIELGEYDEAAEELRLSAANDMNTSPHLAWGNLGLAQLSAGRTEEAIQSLQQAISLQPRFCVGYERLGRAYFQAGELESAEEALIRATTADESCTNNPWLQGAYRLRGEVRARLGRPDEALNDFTRCIELGVQTSHGRACQEFLDAVN